MHKTFYLLLEQKTFIEAHALELKTAFIWSNHLQQTLFTNFVHLYFVHCILLKIYF